MYCIFMSCHFWTYHFFNGLGQISDRSEPIIIVYFQGHRGGQRGKLSWALWQQTGSTMAYYVLSIVARVTFESDLNLRRILPARRYASAGNSDRNVSVRPSVRLSVKRRYCVKTKKASGTISSPSGSPKTLVFWRQVSSPNSKGFPSEREPQTRGGRKKISDFLALSVYISKTVADTAKVTISD